MKKTLFVLFFFGLSLVALAQPKIKVEEEVHDFGTIIEGDQAVHEFIIENTGDQPLVISKVQASCGCTTPFWTRDPIAPGGVGRVKASYNSRGRPGNFRKGITITSNGEPQRKTVYITGTVERFMKKDPEDLKLSAKAELKKTTFDVGKVEQNRPVEVKVPIANRGIRNLQVNGVTSACRCVSYEMSKPMIEQDEEDFITLIYTPRAIGEQVEQVVIRTNDITNSNYQVKLKANVVEDLGKRSIMDEGSGSSYFK